MNELRHAYQNVVVFNDGSVWLYCDDSAPAEVNAKLKAQVLAECDRRARDPKALVKDFRVRRPGDAVANDLPAGTAYAEWFEKEILQTA